MTSLAKYLDHQNVVEQFAAYGEQHGLRRRNLMIQKSHHLLDRYLKSRIIYNMQSEQSWIEYLNQDDVAINTALKIFKDSAAFPQKPKGKGKNGARPAKKS
jgi:carboxyl-terminal processing protease